MSLVRPFDDSTTQLRDFRPIRLTSQCAVVARSGIMRRSVLHVIHTLCSRLCSYWSIASCFILLCVMLCSYVCPPSRSWRGDPLACAFEHSIRPTYVHGCGRLSITLVLRSAYRSRSGTMSYPARDCPCAAGTSAVSSSSGSCGRCTFGGGAKHAGAISPLNTNVPYLR